jgi:crotonobetainyl-CoA:carnitine CoA-transferase CaiB-like acyl-CoA transferase
MAVLDGIRVLDFGRYGRPIACAAGYLGAEVIRIEKRGGGEDRYIAPLQPRVKRRFPADRLQQKSLTLDPVTPEGREVIRRLVRTADVVVANLPHPRCNHLASITQRCDRIDPT